MRPTASDLVSVLAYCNDCEWSSSAKNALANAARHHDAHDHVVIVEQSTITRYGDERAPAGQMTVEELTA